MTKRLSASLALMSVAIAATSAAAQVVFTSFGSGGTYSPSFYYTDSLGTPPAGSEVGFAFSPSASGDLTQLRSPLVRASGANFSMRIAVYRESVSIPGNLIGSWSVSPARFPGPPPIVTYPVPPGIFVETGSTYFLTVKTLNNSGGWNWYASSPMVPGRQVYHPVGGPWTEDPRSTLPAFELSIPAVPGATVLTMALAMFTSRPRRIQC